MSAAEPRAGSPGRDVALAALRAAWWRGGLLLLAFLCGLSGLLLGAGVSDREGIPESGLLTKVYYALGLFVFGGMDLGMPRGGPPAARALLWTAYFVCPSITAAAVVEGAVRLLRPERWALRRLSRHVVIAGCGDLARTYIEELRRCDPRRVIVLVDVRADAELLAELRHDPRAHAVVGDITSRAVRDLVAVDRAARVLLLTGDDMVNVEAAHDITTMNPSLVGHVATHVANLALMRDLQAAGVPFAAGLFNSHQVAACHVVDHVLLPAFERTAHVDEVVLAGFGRFGQSMLVELDARAADKLGRVLVIDRDATTNLRRFRDQVHLAGTYAVDAVDGDVNDPDVWTRGLQDPGARSPSDVARRPVVVLGCDDEGANLHSALWLARTRPGGLLLVRTYRGSSLVAAMARHFGYEAAVVSTHLRASMREIGCFGLI